MAGRPSESEREDEKAHARGPLTCWHYPLCARSAYSRTARRRAARPAPAGPRGGLSLHSALRRIPGAGPRRRRLMHARRGGRADGARSIARRGPVDPQNEQSPARGRLRAATRAGPARNPGGARGAALPPAAGALPGPLLLLSRRSPAPAINWAAVGLRLGAAGHALARSASEYWALAARPPGRAVITRWAGAIGPSGARPPAGANLESGISREHRRRS